MSIFYFRCTRKPDFKNIQKIDYDEYWRKRGFEMRSKLMEREEIFFDWIPNGSKVLDIGCGTSRLLYELKIRKQCDCTGLDTSQVVIEGQKKAGIKAYVDDIERRGFSLEDKYDYIIMSELVEHLRVPEDFIKRISANTEHFIISIPNSAFYRYRTGLLFKGRFFTQWFMHPSEHLRYWSHIDFLDWLDAMGLEVLESPASNGFELGFDFKNLWPNMFGHQMCYLAKVKK